MHERAAATAAALLEVVDQALCAETDPEAFFPPGGRDAAIVAFCRRCPIRAECAAHALEYGVEGIWGGLTVADRQRIWRQTGRGRYDPYQVTAGITDPDHLSPAAAAKRQQRARAAA